VESQILFEVMGFTAIFYTFLVSVATVALVKDFVEYWRLLSNWIRGGIAVSLYT
jgi:ABC-type multidrug transport system permease subunit